MAKPCHTLAGVTAVDLATYQAAPLCATLLGEFGADVIKVEQPRVGDDLRRLVRSVAPSGGGSYWWFFEDPHVRARENIVSVVLPWLGRIAMPGVVPRLTLTPGRIEGAGPSRPGEHNMEIYGEKLGLSSAELTRLSERGVI